MSFTPKKPENTDDGGRVTLRRLLLAKQLFLHASEHAKKRGGVDKIIAVHNFHNSIEVTLKAILSHYAIPASKQFLDFETLMKSVDDYFKEAGVQIPYRRDIGQLNAERNMVQHNAREPEESGMDEWRVFTEKFLRQAFELYFGLDFDQLSQVELVDDEALREMLRLAVWCAENGSAKESLVMSAFALEFAISSCIATPSIPAYGFSMSEVSEDNEAYNAIETLNKEVYYLIQDVYVLGNVVKDIGSSVDLLSRGVNLLDYERFVDLTPDITGRHLLTAMPGGNDSADETDGSPEPEHTERLEAGADEQKPAYLAASWDGRGADAETGRWAAHFAVSAILQLQTAEPPPHLPAEHAALAEELISTKGAAASFDEPSGSRASSDSDPRRHRRRFLRRLMARAAISPEMDKTDEEN